MTESPLAIVFGGGGARAAYQVGHLRWLARRMPDLEIPIVTGVSMGAINAVHLSRFRGPFPDAVDALARHWSRFTTNRVARSNRSWVGGLAFRGLGRLVGRRPASRPLAPLDTSPLRAFLMEAFGGSAAAIPGIADNLAGGRLSAVAITTTDLSAGYATTWFQDRRGVGWEESDGNRGIAATLGLDHLMATMAVPFLFPAIRIGSSWHADGVIRQTTPLTPAINLGAGRILSISTRHAGGDASQGRADQEPYPALGQVGGVMLTSVLESMLDANVRRLDEMRTLAGGLPEPIRPEAMPAHTLVLRPSMDLGRLALDYESRLPRSSRWLARGLGIGQMRNLDLFSNLVFDPDYVAALIALGDRDAEARADEIEALVRAC